jgi:UDP-glucose 4-epimerase
MRSFVTGAGGFIGSCLVDRLLAAGHEVVGYDNFSTGHEGFLVTARQSVRFRLVKGDLLDGAALTRAMDGTEQVFHLAANADVRFGTEHPRRDLEQNTLATFNVLEAMRAVGIRRIAFSSTGSVYGEATVVPTPEDAPFPVQTSLYGASKLACEGLIAAYCEGFGFQGFVFDFYRALRRDPTRLHILGNGQQKKSYLYVQDCIDGVFTAMEQAKGAYNVFNLGTDEYCEVNQSAGWISARLGLMPQFTYGGGERGWIGDSPMIFLDCSKARALGWKPKLTIQESVLRTVDWLKCNPTITGDRP